jgi:Flp pilus assembly pilin Flp
VSCDTEFGAVLQYVKLWLMLGADRQAVTALEYGLIAGVIVATIMFGFTLLAGDLSQQFQNVGNGVTSN